MTLQDETLKTLKEEVSAVKSYPVIFVNETAIRKNAKRQTNILFELTVDFLLSNGLYLQTAEINYQ